MGVSCQRPRKSVRRRWHPESVAEKRSIFSKRKGDDRSVLEQGTTDMRLRHVDVHLVRMRVPENPGVREMLFNTSHVSEEFYNMTRTHFAKQTF